MKIQNNTFTYIDVLIFIVILSIPFYFLRIDFFSSSISILTLNLSLLCGLLLIINYKSLFWTFKKEFLFWIFSVLFIFSFIPPLLFHPSTHGYGAFVEWILLPALTSFLLLSHALNRPTTIITLRYSLTMLLFITSSIALAYLILGQLTYDARLHAFYLSPNHLAMSITPLICITTALFFTSSSIFTRYFIIATLIISSIVLFFTNSFTSIISILLALSFVFFIKSKQKIFLFLIGLLCLFLIIFVGYSKYNHINHDTKRNSLVSRYEIWVVATHQIQKHTLLSNARIDTFQDIYLTQQQFYKPYLTWSAPTPHNLILTLWISGGFFTVLFFAFLCARWLYISFINYKKTKNTAILLYVAAFLTILLSGILDTPYWKNDLSIIFWLILLLQLFK